MTEKEHINAMDLNERFRFFLAHTGGQGWRAMGLARAEQAAEQGAYYYAWETEPNPNTDWMDDTQRSDLAIGLLTVNTVWLLERRGVGYNWPHQCAAGVAKYHGDDVVRRVVEADLAHRQGLGYVLEAMPGLEDPARIDEDAAGELARGVG